MPFLDRTTVTLEPLVVAVRESIGPYIADNARLDVQEALYGGLVYQLSAKVLARKTAADSHVYEVQHPASWWQHLKHSHAPAWFLRRYPVQYDTTRVEADFKRYATYPKADMVLPPDRFGYPVTVEFGHSSAVSPWPCERKADVPAAPVFMDRGEVAYRLGSTKAMSRSSAWDHLSGPYGTVNAVLEGLAELGVNPDELVRVAA